MQLQAHGSIPFSMIDLTFDTHFSF
uniref:Uncharacterized protein n=1 Tax=Arundo donax TaxID=35708 RepID=A0A0A8XXR7_ARUDO